MKFLKNKLKFIYFIIFITLSNCQTVDEVGKVMRNEKVSSTDEFLVKKNQPLVIPPNLRELPVPGDINKDIKKNSKNIKEKKIGNLEKTILNEIKN
tara:strand:- start:281 stop:568 length:288 start_codon:yes stop_codon:yes gene_type:complete